MKRINASDIEGYGKFAVILKCLLSKKHITQGELASATGLSNATITNYIKGRFTPSQQNLEKIAQYLDVPPQSFYDDVTEYTPYLNATEINFAEKLSTLMKKKGITQEQLAKAIGVSRQTVNYYVNGKMMPMEEVLSKICDYFDVEDSYFFTDEPPEENQCSMKLIVTEMPVEKAQCMFSRVDYAHEYKECKFGGLCDLNNGACSHLCAIYDSGAYGAFTIAVRKEGESE